MKEAYRAYERKSHAGARTFRNRFDESEQYCGQKG